MSLWKPNFIKEWRALLKEKGIKGFIREKGWKIIVLFFLYYLIRDSILYIIIPYLVINNMIQCQ